MMKTLTNPYLVETTPKRRAKANAYSKKKETHLKAPTRDWMLKLFKE